MKKNLKVIIAIIVVILCIALSIYFITKYNTKVEEIPTPVTTTTTKRAEVGTTGEFAYDLLRYVNSENKNVLISPYSINTAFSMLKEGAVGNTYDEIDKLIPNKPATIDNENIKIANTLFIKDMYKGSIDTDYINKLEEEYKSGFIYDAFVTPDVINNWVNEHTDGMINKLVDSIDPQFALGIVNAVAIDVKWKNPFQCYNTHSAEFTKKDGTKKNVEMMFESYEYSGRYLKNDNAEGIILPYQDETNLEYIAIKPNGNIDDYINKFGSKELADLLSTEDIKNVDLSLPRYSYDYEYKDLDYDLKQLGMKDMYDPNKANFTKIISTDSMSKYNMDSFYVSSVIHKTYISLNEKGTRAAAVTGIMMATNTAIPEEKEIVRLDFDRTFLYIIREKTTNEILFMGVVDDPNEWKGTTCEKEE